VELLPINVTRPSVMLPPVMVMVLVCVPGIALIALVPLMDVSVVHVAPRLEHVSSLTQTIVHQFHVLMENSTNGLLAVFLVVVESEPEQDKSIELLLMVVLTVSLPMLPKTKPVIPPAVLSLVLGLLGVVLTPVPKPVVVELKLKPDPLPAQFVMELLVLDLLLTQPLVTLNAVLLIVFGTTGVAFQDVPRLVELELKLKPEPRSMKFVVVTLVMDQLPRLKIVTQTLAQSLVLETGPNGPPSVHAMEQAQSPQSPDTTLSPPLLQLELLLELLVLTQVTHKKTEPVLPPTAVEQSIVLDVTSPLHVLVPIHSVLVPTSLIK